MDLSRLPSDHKAVIESLSEALFDINDIPSMRKAGLDLGQTMTNRALFEVDVENHSVQDEAGRHLPVRIYRPSGANGPLPTLLWIHGGGLVAGHIDQDDGLCRETASRVLCMVASVGYRLAPENPFPAALEDCFTALSWLESEGNHLRVDTNRLAIGGASAGGGLAASLALLARDRQGPKVCFQLLIAPMLDDSNSTDSCQRINHPKLWNRHINLLAWRAYLGHEPGSPEVPREAVPARADNLAGVPPAYLAIGEYDMFLDEVVAYAQRLIADGVATELHVYPGAFHGSEQLVPDSPVSVRFNDDKYRALRRSLKVGVG